MREAENVSERDSSMQLSSSKLCSLDEMQCNPGIPDFASLHPGYVTTAAE
jgi:hypothetical protein